jgi:hypothetical protein
MKTRYSYTPEEIVNEMGISELTNTDEDTFWYSNKRFEGRYKHEFAKVGDTFHDGNNADDWKVIAANTQFKRLIVENLTQGGTRIVFWN